MCDQQPLGRLAKLSIEQMPVLHSDVICLGVSARIFHRTSTREYQILESSQNDFKKQTANGCEKSLIHGVPSG